MPYPGEVIVTLNPTRTYVRREGWGLTRSAAAFRSAVFVDGEWKPAGLADPDALWLTPEKGVLRLRPSPLRSDLMENAAFAPFWLGLDKWTYRTGDLVEVSRAELASNPKQLVTSRADPDAALQGMLTAPSIAAGMTLPANMVWLCETKDALNVNEGFSFIITPFGLGTDRAGELLRILFGGRFALKFQMGGTVQLLDQAGPAGSPQWVVRRTFNISQGGVDHTREFQVTVIPWGPQTITILFSQAPQSDEAEAGKVGSGTHTSFNYETKKYGFTPSYNSGTRVHAVTAASKIAVACRKEDHTLALTPCVARYLGGVLVVLADEAIDEPHPAAVPTAVAYGFFGQNKTGLVPPELPAQIYSGAGRVGPGLVTYTNEKNAAWTAAKDTKLVTKFYMETNYHASAAEANNRGLYSPEIWFIEYELPVETHSVGQNQVLEGVKKVSFAYGVRFDCKTGRVLYDRTQDWTNLYKLDAAMDIVVWNHTATKSYKWCGVIQQSRPTLENHTGKTDPGPQKSTGIVTEDTDLVSMQDELNNTSVGFFYSMTNKSMGQLIKAALMRGGVPAAKITIHASLMTMVVDGWEGANDLKTTLETATAGDVIRSLQRLYGLQGKHTPIELRCLIRGDEYLVHPSADYNPETIPTKVFFLATDSLPEDVMTAIDVDRWTGIEGTQYFRVYGKPEFEICRPDFNHLVGVCAIGSGDGSDRITSYIPPRPTSLTDVTQPDFAGRVRSRFVGPNELGMISTRLELNRALRRLYDVESRHSVILGLQAEWQAGEILEDDVFMVIGHALHDDLEEFGSRFLQGENVSYGAFRVLSVAPELSLFAPPPLPPLEEEEPPPEEEEEDPPPVGVPGYFGGHVSDDSTARLAGYQAYYVLEYLGETNHPDYPMFTLDTPLYGRLPVEEE